MKRLAIAVDGPAGSGKSTISRRLADRLDITYIDTGAMYRAVALGLLERGISPEEVDEVERVLDQMAIDFEEGTIYLDGRDVSAAIREPRVHDTVSQVAVLPAVRERLVALQQQMAGQKSVILDGRDIGTVVLPDADVKFFLTATVEERARRRVAELKGAGHAADLEEMMRSIAERDARDAGREVGPLKKAADAHEIDTTHLDIDGVLDAMMTIIRKVVGA